MWHWGDDVTSWVDWYPGEPDSNDDRLVLQGFIVITIFSVFSNVLGFYFASGGMDDFF